MSKIYINEVDLTTPERIPQDESNVVYIPGFAASTIQAGATFADANVPTLCRTVNEFQSFFGTRAPVFDKDYTYTELGFSEKSHFATNMFTMGEPDPSYVYAKELLSFGIPVLYERINSETVANADKMYKYLAGAFIDAKRLQKTISSGTLLPDMIELDQELFVKATPDAGDYTYLAIKSGDSFKWRYLDAELTNDELAQRGIIISKDNVTVGDKFTITLVVEDAQLSDKSIFDVKYITTGGYPVFENNAGIDVSMSNLAALRGDCIALIDHTNYPERELLGNASLYYAVSHTQLPTRSQSYAAMFTPWYNYKSVYNYTDDNSGVVSMPASFAYLSCLGNSVQSNPSWIAISGAARGKVSRLSSVCLTKTLTNSIADGYTPDTGIAINPITNIRPYGQCIWGNRTLVDNSANTGTTALSFLNIRSLVCDVKKVVFNACQACLFEQNTDILWLNFVNRITPTLDTMVSGYGLSGYKIIKTAPSDKSIITATIRIYPIYAIESFDITLYIEDGEVAVEE